MNDCGITRKKQIQLEKAIKEEQAAINFRRNDDDKVDCLIQTDDIDENQPQLFTDNANAYDSEINFFRVVNSLEDIGEDLIDFNQLLNFNIVKEKSQLTPKQQDDDRVIDKEEACHVCLSLMQNAPYQLDSKFFCSEVCFLAHKHSQKQIETKIAEYNDQIKRYEDLAEKTKDNIAAILEDTQDSMPIEIKDIDLSSDIEIHYSNERIITKF